ncbi:MAG: 2-amino-4-hydroxy-6-hydroxymethyldihydropteridine diphosphokinase [Gammaproteobacteria bacterium]|nr:2-amino-4-hydroxy-6-hydroxymethyldihydropteridine diphosphokinase [Gammaproteobacteria bacterium]
MTESAGTTSWIALGSNLAGEVGGPREQLESACAMLADLPGTEFLRRSSWYCSAPMGPVAQDDFINGVAEITTLLEPLALLESLQVIEAAHDRRREQHWGPRTLDLDILLYGDEVIESDRLVVPHPGIPQRNFVLYPLRELEPELEIPGIGAVSKLAAAVDSSGITCLADDGKER